jgi:hypothetical protein
MPSVIISVPPFPNVPQLTGVPQLIRSNEFPASPLPTIGTETQAPLWAASQGAPTWGVFDANLNRVVTPDSVLNFDNRNEWQIPDFPVQAGSFTTYNKVVKPYEISLRMTKGGSLSDRTAFINQIKTIAGDTNLYTILTPEISYVGVNITRYEITRRGAEGAFFLAEVDIFFRQVLQTPALYSTTSANTTNAQNPAAVPAVNNGNVQPSSAVPAVAQQVAANAISATLF